MDQPTRPAVGIDIGEGNLHLATHDPACRPAQWPVTILDLSDDDWHIKLSQYVPAHAIVALEPTGWYYSRPPIAWLAHTRPDVTILYVAHHQTQATRDDRVATQKTDPNDARALALKASDMATHGWTLGAHVHEERLEILNTELRLAILEYKRAMKTRSIHTNRMKLFAHGIWPSLSKHLAIYERALSAGLATPRQIKDAVTNIEQLPLPQYAHKRTRTNATKLAATLPDLPDPPEAIIRGLLAARDARDECATKLQEIQGRLRKLITQPPLAEISSLWLTIPGASPVTIAALHSAAKCMADQLSPDEFRAACGCHPSRQESGKTTEAKDAKRGFRPAKGLLHMWTVQLLSSTTSPANPIRDYFLKLKADGNLNAIHAARGKLCRILSGIARTKTPYHYEGTRPQKEPSCPASSQDSEPPRPPTQT